MDCQNVRMLRKVCAAVLALVALPAMSAIMPPGYQELKWIASTGSQWIDTGVHPDASTSVEMHFGNVTYEANRALFGQDWSGDQYLFNMRSSKFYFHGSGGAMVGVQANTDYFVVVSTDAKVRIGVEGGSVTNAYSTRLGTAADKNLALFGCITDRGKNSKFRMYSFRLWKNGELVRDYVPCEETESGEIGLYDLANNKFYGSSGSGTFVSGGAAFSNDQLVLSAVPDNSAVKAIPGFGSSWLHRPGEMVSLVLPPAVTNGMSIATIDGWIRYEYNGAEDEWVEVARNTEADKLDASFVFGDAPVKVELQCIAFSPEFSRASLKSAYQEVDLIEFTGTQYVDTGIIPSAHEIQVVYQPVAYVHGGSLFGTQSAGKYTHWTGYSNRYYWGLSNSEGNSGSYAWNSRLHNLDFNRKDGNEYVITFDGTEMYRGTTMSKSGQSLRIGKRELSGTAQFKAKVYSFKVIGHERGNLVGNLVPAVRKADSVAGFYDIVSDRFLENLGTGAFVAGSPVVRDYLVVSATIGAKNNFGSWREYGTYSNIPSGWVIQLSTPATMTDNGVDAVCTGWKLYDCDGNVVESGDGNSFTYVQDAPRAYRSLVWTYEPAAGVNSFNGTESGEWANPRNWSMGRVPAATDDVVIRGDSVTCAVDSSVTVKSLTLEGGAILTVQAPAAANPSTIANVYPGAFKFNVTGTFRIASGSTFTPVTDELTGNPVFVNCSDFILEEGAIVDATGKGYGWKSKTGVDTASLEGIIVQNDAYTYCPSPGMSYGSTAGHAAGGSRKISYSFAYAPWLSGGASGVYNSLASGYGVSTVWSGCARGGGAVVIFASGSQKVAGKIVANGLYRFYNASAGGAIWLVGKEFDILSTAKLSARGSGDNYGALNSGGRISIGAGLSAAQIDALAAGTDPATLGLLKGDNLDFIDAHTYRGVSNTGVSPIDSVLTDNGTRTYTVNPGECVLIAVSASGVYGADALGGAVVVDPASEISIGVERLKAADADDVHYTASGWRLLDGENVIASGAGNTATFTLDADYAKLNLEWTISSITKDPEPDFFASLISDDAADKTFTGENGGVWEEASNWTPAGVPGLGNSVSIEGKTVYATSVIGAKTLSIGSDAMLVVGGKGEDALNQTTAEGSRFGLKVAGDLSLDGTLSLGGRDLTVPTRMYIGGNMALNGSALLAVYAKRATDVDFATLYAEATPVTVAGAITLGGASRIVPDADYMTGAAVRFTAGSVEISTDAKFDAVGRGYGWFCVFGELNSKVRTAVLSGNDSIASVAHHESYAPGAGGSLHSNSSGAGYGGTGDRKDIHRGLSYGYAYAPFLPGSCGSSTDAADRGAGVIWIDCNGQFTLNGTLDASGVSSAVSGKQFNSSGGGIWISALGFTAGSQSAILAGGGSTPGSNYGAAGGRVSLAIATTAEDREKLARGEVPAELDYSDSISGVPTLSVAGGAGSYSSGTTPFMAADGTFTTVRGSVVVPTLHVTGYPVEAVSDGVAYGGIATDIGATLTLRASACGTDPASQFIRYSCTGYLATNSAGEVVASGDGLTATITIADTDTYFSWIWGDKETASRVEITPECGGSVLFDGALYTASFNVWAKGDIELRAVPSDTSQYEFLYWLGDVPGGHETDAVLTLPGGKFRSVKPVFRRKAAPTSAVWLGGNGDWTDSAMWAGGNIPGLDDEVVIEGGMCMVSNYVKCASLTVGGTAKLIAGANLRSGVTTVVPTYPNLNLLPYDGVLNDAASVKVTGTLTVAGTAEMALGADGETYATYLEAGKVILADSAKMMVVASPRTESLTYDTGTGFVRVGSDFAIRDTAVFYPVSDSYSGGSVVCNVGGRFSVAAGASVDADDAGFKIHVEMDPQSLEPLPQCTGYATGAAHGGKGSGNKGTVYDFLYAPRMPGACGVNVYQGTPANAQPGGGVVRIHAGRLDISGTVTASNARYVGRYLGGAGGTIWLTGDTVAFKPGAALRTVGGRTLYGSGADGAGGGRISVCRGLSSVEFDALLTDGDTLPTGRISLHADSRVLDAVAFTNLFKEVTVDASGSKNAKAGTFVFIDARQPGTQLILR